MSENFGARIQEMRERLEELRRLQKSLAARMQQVVTATQLSIATDWEERYVAEGFDELEKYANEGDS